MTQEKFSRKSLEAWMEEGESFTCKESQSRWCFRELVSLYHNGITTEEILSMLTHFMEEEKILRVLSALEEEHLDRI